MTRRRIGWLCGVILAAALLLAPSPAGAQQQDASASAEASDTASLRIQEGFNAATRQAFSESFPDGKRSVVERQMAGTASLLTTAHRYALRGQNERSAYREALAYQVASRLALDQDQFAEAMYLTFHARSLGRGVIRANTTSLPADYQPEDLELIKRAGSVEAGELEEYVQRAKEDVPEVEWLFAE